MATLYRPVLIESADLPMDKFPEGTIATHPDHWPVERCSCSRWESEGPDRYNPDMIGWTALVPIEAEERVAEEKRLRMKATAAATQAASRVEAVEQVLSKHEAVLGDNLGVPVELIRRALEGDQA